MSEHNITQQKKRKKRKKFVEESIKAILKGNIIYDVKFQFVASVQVR